MDSIFTEHDDLYDQTREDLKPRPSPTSYSGSGSLLTGHHHAKFTTNVPQGVDPYEFSDRLSTNIGRRPAPSFFGWGSTVNEPTETPSDCTTIFMPSLVSKASSEDKSEHSVMVEAKPGHILAGKNGSAGINYGTTPRQLDDGQWVVDTEKDSFGDSSGWTGPIRYFVGSHVLNPHLKGVMNDTYSSMTSEKEPAETK
ncbi:MAG: hypothetical protein ACTHU0_23145 [Kofleriaceae bacterium]